MNIFSVIGSSTLRVTVPDGAFEEVIKFKAVKKELHELEIICRRFYNQEMRKSSETNHLSEDNPRFQEYKSRTDQVYSSIELPILGTSPKCLELREMFRALSPSMSPGELVSHLRDVKSAVQEHFDVIGQNLMNQVESNPATSISDVSV